MPCLLAIGCYIYTSGFQIDARIITSDGWGYYLALPSVFIYADPHLTFLNQIDLPSEILQYRFADGTWQGLSVHGAGYLNKYALGLAVMQLPFFLVALAIGRLLNGSVNGFESIFQLTNLISGVFYFGLGSLFCYRACRLRYGRVASALTLGVTLLASNILNYASANVSYSHIYGYCLVAGLIFLTISYVESGEPPALCAFVLFGLLMGLAVTVRPTNGVYSILLIVFAYGTPWRLFLVRGACSLLASAVAASPQLVWWYVTTGHPIYYSYTGEGFNFASPELRNYLFSIRKGVFFWHPLYLLMIGALLATLPRRPLEGAASIAIVLIALYIGASWGDYTFGDSFGSRHSIELLPILIVPFAGAIAALLQSRGRWVISTLGLMLIAVNLIQYRGYIKGKLLPNDNTRVTYLRFWADTLTAPVIERYIPPAR